MAQLTVLLSSTDTEFRAHVTKCLRASGTSVALVDERHATANPPSLTVVDIRHGAKSGEAIERLRGLWPAATVIAIASSAQPEQILQAMRAGANEYLAWPLDESFTAAIHRAALISYLEGCSLKHARPFFLAVTLLAPGLFADEGMWMPQQIPELAAKLKSMGFKGDPKAFADLTGQPMGAVVSLGGCTASFVSQDALIVGDHDHPFPTRPQPRQQKSGRSPERPTASPISRATGPTRRTCRSNGPTK